MKTGARTVLVITGLLLFSVATFLLVVNRPFLELPLARPALTFSHNIPYLLYLHVIQWIVGPRVVSVIVANGVLMLGISLLVFRLGWRMANPRYNYLGAITSLLLVETNPLVILLPLALGFFGGSLLAILLLLAFLVVMLALENWSTFMRAIVLAVIWSFFLWVHVPMALLLAFSMIPWVLYNRRPLPAVGVFVSMIFLGLFLFSSAWMLGCALMQKWILVSGPMEAAQALISYFQQGVSVTWSGGISVMGSRMVRVAGWVSPFTVILGVWAVFDALRRMIQNRRASVADLAALSSLVVLGAVLGTAGKETLPGAWYVLALLALWAPLIARDLALKENFYSRCFRTTTLISFGVCGAVLWVLQRDPSAGLTPSFDSLVKVCLAVGVMGGLSHAFFRKHPITLENRLRAVLAGAALAYGLILDCFLFR